MSRMSEIHMEIESLVLEGRLSNVEISKILNVPLDWVESVEESLAESGYYEDMDTE